MPASLAEASRATRVRVDFLEAIERDSFNFVSGHVYVRGMLRSYATWLRLDPNEISAEFDRAFGGGETQQVTPSNISPRGERSRLSVRPRKPPWAILGSVALAVLLVLLVVSLLANNGPKVAQSPPVSASPTTPAASPAPSPTAPGPAPTNIQLVVSVTQSTSWVRVVLGQTIPSLVMFQGILAKGVSRSFTASDVLVVNFGNTGAVDVNVNGRDLGAPGALGQAGAFLISPSGTLTPDPSAVTAQPPGQPVLLH